MSKFKIILSEFDPKNGVSFVSLKYKGETFIGWAAFNPNDEVPVSSFLGCRIAEKRAAIKALKHEYKKALAEYDAIITFISDYGSTYEPDTYVTKGIAQKWSELQDRKRIIDNIQKSIQVDIDNYYKFQEERKKKKESC